MADNSTPPVDTTSTTDRIKEMGDVFDRAIKVSMEITKLTTEKKSELDATKQRPQN